MHTISSYRVNRPTNIQTQTQTDTETEYGDVEAEVFLVHVPAFLRNKEEIVRVFMTDDV